MVIGVAVGGGSALLIAAAAVVAVASRKSKKSMNIKIKINGGPEDSFDDFTGTSVSVAVPKMTANPLHASNTRKQSSDSDTGDEGDMLSKVGKENRRFFF